MGKNLLDHHWIFDTGDDPDCAAAAPAGLDVDAEDPFQALRPEARRGRRRGDKKANREPTPGSKDRFGSIPPFAASL